MGDNKPKSGEGVKLVSKLGREAQRVKKLERQTRGIELYIKEEGHITNVCKLLRIHRNTWNKWTKDDQFNHLVMLADKILDDDMERVLIGKAKRGASAELLFYLKKRHARYKDMPTTIGVRGEGKVEVIIQDYKSKE